MGEDKSTETPDKKITTEVRPYCLVRVILLRIDGASLRLGAPERCSWSLQKSTARSYGDL